MTCHWLTDGTARGRQFPHLAALAAVGVGMEGEHDHEAEVQLGMADDVILMLSRLKRSDVHAGCALCPWEVFIHI